MLLGWALGLFHEFYVVLVHAMVAIGLVGLVLSQFLKLLPYPAVQVYKGLIALVSLVLLCVGLFLSGTIYSGEKYEKEKAELLVENKRLDTLAKEATGKVHIKYVDRVKIIKQKGETITKYVDKYITKEVDTKYPVPNRAIIVLDAAAKELPESGSGSDGPSRTP